MAGITGIGNSQRLEEYLDVLAQNARQKGLLLPQEAFILLCAVYMHDLGYGLNGSPDAVGHPKRSRDLILRDPEQYLLGDFRRMPGRPPRVAEAVGWVCYGHSDEKFLPLEKVPNDFGDQSFSSEVLNLRKLAALLRIADEADDPYIRLVDDSYHPIRSKTPLVHIGEETIAWHWKNAGIDSPADFLDRLKEKQKILLTSLDYLRDRGLGYWYLVLYPQVAGSTPFMPEEPVKTFVGREKDLEALHRIIKRCRAGALTGVVGTGGIGKTELARMYAKRFGPDYPGGVFWASMKGSNWKVQAERILEQLRPGAKPFVFPDEAKAKEEVTKALGRNDAILIIDNVTERDQIIRPGCFLLLTSRDVEIFGVIPHGVIHKLQGLSIQESMQLLEKILGPQRVRINAEGAKRIVEMLGGMPLAVEISAQHLADAPDLSFPEYIGSIEGKVQELRLEGYPDKDVAASLELSLEQLHGIKDGAHIIALFDAAGVCAPSRFSSQTLATAAGLAQMHSVRLSTLVGKLHNRSLLGFEQASFLFSIHPLLRQLAEERVKANPKRAKSFMTNHCLYFLGYSHKNSDNPEKLIAEKDGIWQAMIQANQLGRSEELAPQFINILSKPYHKLIMKGRHEEAFQYLKKLNLFSIYEIGQSRLLVDLFEPLLKNDALLEDHSRGWVFNFAAWTFFDIGDMQKPIELYKRALEVFRQIGDLHSQGSVLGNMGSAYEALGDYQEAMKHYEQALLVARTIGDRQSEGISLGNMGWLYISLGNAQKAIELSEQGLAIARIIGDMQIQRNILGNMGSAFAALGEYRKAIDHYEQALVIARKIGDTRGEGSILVGMGSAYDGIAEHHKSLAYFEQALSITRMIGDTRGEGIVLGNIGLTYAHLGDYRQAITFHEQHLEITRKIKDVKSEGKVLENIGTAYAAIGESRKAIEIYEQSLEIFRRIEDLQGEGAALMYVGLVYSNLGEYGKALVLLEQTLTINRKIRDARGEGKTLATLGLVYARLGDDSKASKSLFAAKAIFSRLGLMDLVQWVEKLAQSFGGLI